MELDFRTDLLPLKNKLFRLSMRILMDSQEAEDTVEDTLVRVWEQSRDEGTNFHVESIEAYCTTICRNLSLDRAEKREHQNTSLDAMQSAGTLIHPAATEGAQQRLEQQEMLNSIRQTMLLLPEIQRSCLELRDVEEMPYQDIAEQLGISEAQVKINIFRARQFLRNKLKPNE